MHRLLGAAQTEVNDSAVVSLYATFEASLRDHIAQQSHHLHAAQQPNPSGSIFKAEILERWCIDRHVEQVVELLRRIRRNALTDGVAQRFEAVEQNALDVSPLGFLHSFFVNRFDHGQSSFVGRRL